jgi:DNA polymerase (family 10)
VYVEDVPRQREEIAVVQAKHPDIQILHGIEVEIMPDGSLDFDDDLLSEFEIVLASLHDPSGQSRSVLETRYLSAIRHPLVNVITHPANRSPGYSDGYDLAFDRLFAEAASAGTALEVDGGPGHLDMDGTLARRAMASEATIVINSDSHRADVLARQMRFGVGTARRGWVEPGRVLNTRPIDDVRAFIARKRRAALRDRG